MLEENQFFYYVQNDLECSNEILSLLPGNSSKKNLASFNFKILCIKLHKGRTNLLHPTYNLLTWYEVETYPGGTQRHNETD